MRKVVAALALLAVVVGCGDESVPSESTPGGVGSTPGLEEAAELMRSIVDDTVAEVLPDRPAISEDGLGRHGCGSETDEEAIDYGFSIDVPADEIDVVIAEVSERWTALGSHDIRHSRGLTFEFDGYLVGLTPFPEEGRVTIGGSTDCFPQG